MKPVFSLVFALALAGCEWVRLPVDNGVYDADGDGYTSLDDCDDFNDNVHPGAQERCNGVDNDCSGAEDDAADAGLWYPDVDGDGYGDPGAAIRACDPPIGYVDLAWDCDDGNRAVNPGAIEDDCTDPADYNCDGFPAGWDSDLDGSPDCLDCAPTDASAFPGAVETCDGADEDCDGVVDNGLVGTTWYLDADGDGWGDASLPTEACGRPEGYAADGTDCDDADSAVHPSAPEACNAADDDCDGAVDEEDRFGNDRWHLDADGDGYGDADVWVGSCVPVEGHVLDGADCDDGDPAISPAADERCDDRDQDCDGEVDEDAIDPVAWYRDADRDAWGDAADVLWFCDRPTGYVADVGDCDDTDRNTSPSDPERCGGGDEDCDGEVDEAGATEGTEWHADADGDGFGDDAVVVTGCEAPAGMVPEGGDCDDDDPLFHPDALEIDCGDDADYNCDGSVGRVDLDGDGWDACEECDDGDPARSPYADETCDDVDQDCDGEVDEDATDAGAWYPDEDADGFGDDARGVLACEAPFGWITDAGDCDDADGAVSPTAVETCLTDADDDCDGDTNLDGEGCVDWYADVDGDGFGVAESLCLCVPEAPYTADDVDDCDDDAPTVNPDGTEVCGNRADDDCDGTAIGCGVAGEMALSDATAKVLGGVAGDTFGFAVLAVDLDGDGTGEVLTGAPGVDDGGAGAGAVYLHEGPFAGGHGTAEARATWIGDAGRDAAGSALAAGDLDGDGILDLVVGAPNDTSGGDGAGAVFVALGPTDTGGALGEVDAIVTGMDADDHAGIALALVDDTDGDGDVEMAVGAYRESGWSANAGAVYVYDGVPGSGAAETSAVAFFAGRASGDFFGRAVANGGDLDGDGVGDLVIGAYANDDTDANAGAVYVFYGPFSGMVSATDADATRRGTTRADAAGFAVAGGSDVDGDGRDDFVVGAFNNDDAAYNAGAAYVMHGPVYGIGYLGSDATLLGEAASDAAGTAVALGDLDDDGLADVAVAGKGTAHGSVGAVWVAYAPLSGVLSLSDAEATLLGEDTDDNVGTALSIGPDTDLDGYRELLVGASGEDTNGADAGAVYLIGGGPGL